MSGMIEIDWKPDDTKLRQFGFIAFAGFSGMAALAWFRLLAFAALSEETRPVVAVVLGGVGASALLFSLVAPRANRPIYLLLSAIALPIGFVLSHVILAFLFYAMITPLGLLFRIIGRDPLERSHDPQATTYWVEPRPRRGKDSYFRQF